MLQRINESLQSSETDFQNGILVLLYCIFAIVLVMKRTLIAPNYWSFTDYWKQSRKRQMQITCFSAPFACHIPVKREMFTIKAKLL